MMVHVLLLRMAVIDPTAFNYDSGANTDDGSCIPFTDGCMDSTLLFMTHQKIRWYRICGDIL